jgi:hypothetical protein
MTKKKPPEVDPMIAVLEEGIRKVIQNEGSAPADVVKAIEAGTKLHLAKHKTDASKNEESYFD